MAPVLKAGFETIPVVSALISEKELQPNNPQTGDSQKVGRPAKKPRIITRDGKTYFSLHHAAKVAGISHYAMYRWIKREITRGVIPLDIISDHVAKQRFISESCLELLVQQRYTFSANTSWQKP